MNRILAWAVLSLLWIIFVVIYSLRLGNILEESPNLSGFLNVGMLEVLFGPPVTLGLIIVAGFALKRK